MGYWIYGRDLRLCRGHVFLQVVTCGHSVLLSISTFTTTLGPHKIMYTSLKAKQDKESYLICNDVAFTWRTNDMALLLKQKFRIYCCLFYSVI